MSRENVEVVRRIYASWGGETAWEMFDPAVEWHTAREDPDAAVHHGIAAVRRFVRGWIDAFPDLKVEATEFLEAGDQVFVGQRTTGHGAASKIEFNWEGAYVWTLREGKVVRVETYSDRSEALEAVGLRE